MRCSPKANAALTPGRNTAVPQGVGPAQDVVGDVAAAVLMIVVTVVPPATPDDVGCDD